jgi:hypothetical protein
VLPRVSTQHEIILLSDGSRDRNWEVISELSPRSPTARPLFFPLNQEALSDLNSVNSFDSLSSRRYQGLIATLDQAVPTVSQAT